MKYYPNIDPDIHVLASNKYFHCYQSKNAYPRWALKIWPLVKEWLIVLHLGTPFISFHWRPLRKSHKS